MSIVFIWFLTLLPNMTKIYVSSNYIVSKAIQQFCGAKGHLGPNKTFETWKRELGMNL